MNGLSFGVAAPQGNATTAASSAGREGGKPAGDGFEQLLKAPPTHSEGKRALGQDRPARPLTPAMAEETDAGEPPAGNVSEAAQRLAPADETSDGKDDAPWPPPGLSMIAPADVLPAPVPMDNPVAALPNATLPAPPMPAAMLPLMEMPAATAPPLSLPLQATPHAMAPQPAIDAALPLPASAMTDQAGMPLPAATAAMPPLTDEASAPLTTEALATLANDADAATAPATPLPSFGLLLQGLAAPEPRPLAATPFPAELATPADLQAPDFDETLGARVSWLAEQKIDHAHIRVTPQGLGPVEVRLQLEGDKVHASFTSAHAEVRHALESTLPRLREMLGEQGLQLAHADVGQQQSGSHTAEGGETSASNGQEAEAGAMTDASPLPGAHTIRLRGLLDAYA